MQHHHRDDVWYGIAWTVTGRLWWNDITAGTLLQQLIARGVAG